MEEVLHTPDFIWQLLSFLRRVSIKPVIEKGLYGYELVAPSIKDFIQTGLDNDTNCVGGTI